MEVLDVDTPHGTARAHVDAARDPTAALVLGHGAGGSIAAPDLTAAAAAARGLGATVVLVEQPYRVAGRRSAAPARQLDVAWLAVLAALDLGDAPLVVGGRSSGARVACRTAADAGAAAVLCLAFPLVAPSGTSRLDELEAVRVPVLVVQGRTDRFGVPEPDARPPTRDVVVVEGDHGLKKDAGAITAAVKAWLPRATSA